VAGGSLTLNGGISANVADRGVWFIGDAGADGVVNGVIANGSNPVNVQKFGTNTWTLNGDNTYTAATTVHAGTLLVNGSQPAATGNVTVNNGATLGGTGTLGGTITANAGSTSHPAPRSGP
jgi:fibronectin-binding autotransporter adhesin